MFLNSRNLDVIVYMLEYNNIPYKKITDYCVEVSDDVSIQSLLDDVRINKVYEVTAKKGLRYMTELCLSSGNGYSTLGEFDSDLMLPDSVYSVITGLVRYVLREHPVISKWMYNDKNLDYFPGSSPSSFSIYYKTKLNNRDVYVYKHVVPSILFDKRPIVDYEDITNEYIDFLNQYSDAIEVKPAKSDLFYQTVLIFVDKDKCERAYDGSDIDEIDDDKIMVDSLDDGSSGEKEVGSPKIGISRVLYRVSAIPLNAGQGSLTLYKPNSRDGLDVAVYRRGESVENVILEKFNHYFDMSKVKVVKKSDSEYYVMERGS